MTWATTAPAAIAKMIAMFTIWPGLADVELKDGPVIANPSAPEVLGIAWAETEDDLAVEGAFSQAGQGAGGYRDLDTYTIHCALGVLIGGDDQAAAIVACRDRAFELLHETGECLATDPTLGRLVFNAGIGSWSLRPDNTDDGILCKLRFGIDVRAVTGP
jgi:hypothetical protein